LPLARSNGRNILFIHIPKAGGTSIEDWLRQVCPLSFHNSRVGHGLPCVPQHFHAELLDYLFDESFIDYSFAVVRNPYWRLLSEYNYRMSHRRRHQAVFPRPSFRRWVTSTLSRYARNQYVYSNHIRPQVQFLFPDTEVFRLEDGLDVMKKRLAEVLGSIPRSEILQRNQSVPLVESIDKGTAAIIQDFYAEDFAKFGYDNESFRQTAAR
jgi:hypothetical protein